MLHHPARCISHLYSPSLKAKPESEVSINEIYNKRAWCNKFISWRKPWFKETAHALGCRQCRYSRESKKASSWKVMSCIENKENTDSHPTKKSKLSLSLKNCDRFKAIMDEKLDTISKPQVPKKMEKSSRWAMTNLREWYDDYNDRNLSAKCPEELLSPEPSKEVLNTWLCVFITEIRGKNGEPYHQKTLQFLLIYCILHHM